MGQTRRVRDTPLPGIYMDDPIKSVECFPLFFDRQKIVFAHGTATESLFPGPEVLKSPRPETREDPRPIFLEIAELDFSPGRARRIARGKVQKQLGNHTASPARPFSPHGVIPALRRRRHF